MKAALRWLCVLPGGLIFAFTPAFLLLTALGFSEWRTEQDGIPAQIIVFPLAFFVFVATGTEIAPMLKRTTAAGLFAGGLTVLVFALFFILSVGRPLYPAWPCVGFALSVLSGWFATRLAWRDKSLFTVTRLFVGKTLHTTDDVAQVGKPNTLRLYGYLLATVAVILLAVIALELRHTSHNRNRNSSSFMPGMPTMPQMPRMPSMPTAQ